MRVAILHSVDPSTSRMDELDTLVQAEAIAAALRNLGHESTTLAFVPDPRTLGDVLRANRSDVVFNLVESVAGQGRLIHLAPALFEAVGLPYTGAGPEALLLTSNKVLAKKLLTAEGIDTPPWVAADSPGRDPSPVSGRYILKPVWEDASVGIDDSAIVEPTNADDLASRLAHRARHLGMDVFAESFVEGREFNLSVLSQERGVELLPPAEIRFTGYEPGKPRIVGYAAKWLPASFEYRSTPRRFDFPAGDRGLLERLRQIARRCWELFGLRGYARVDFRVDDSGRPWVLEVNANPCLSPDAGFAAAAKQRGLAYERLIDQIIVAARAASLTTWRRAAELGRAS